VTAAAPASVDSGEQITGTELVNVVLDLIQIARDNTDLHAEVAQLKNFLIGYMAGVNDQAWADGISRPLTGLAADHLRRAYEILAGGGR
jgi:hypothetical protein